MMIRFLINNIFHFIQTILDVFETEQYHSQKSSYTFERDMAKSMEFKKNGNFTKSWTWFLIHKIYRMIWSAFRPSDDACALNYNIPGNMFCSVILSYLQEIVKIFIMMNIWKNVFKI